jgi:hypothetical protein
MPMSKAGVCSRLAVGALAAVRPGPAQWLNNSDQETPRGRLPAVTRLRGLPESGSLLLKPRGYSTRCNRHFRYQPECGARNADRMWPVRRSNRRKPFCGRQQPALFSISNKVFGYGTAERSNFHKFRTLEREVINSFNKAEIAQPT